MRRISFKSESGAILPIVIILALALTITGIAFLNAGVMENSLVRREIDKNQAFWLAEAGVEATIWQFNYGDPSWPGWSYDEVTGYYHSPTENVEDPQGSSVGDYEVIVEGKEGDNPVIESTGYVPSIDAENKVERTVRVTLERTLHGIFDYAIASGEWIKLENPDTKVIGNVYAAGDITIEDATIDGDARTTEGGIDNGGIVTGEEREDWPPEVFPVWNAYDSLYLQGKIPIPEGYPLLTEGYPPCDWVEDPSGVVWLTIEGMEEGYPITDILYVKGNVKISDSILVGPGAIVATGQIKVEAGSQVGNKLATVSLISIYESDPYPPLDPHEDDPAILIEKSSTIEGGSEIYGGLWAPFGVIKIEDDAMLLGSAVSENIHKIEVGSGVEVIHGDLDPSFLPSIYTQQLWEQM